MVSSSAATTFVTPQRKIFARAAISKSSNSTARPPKPRASTTRATSLLAAYRTLFRQWELVFAIGAANRRRGSPPTKLAAALAQVARDDHARRHVSTRRLTRMCTVTLIARRNGYALGMNRDEKLTRVDSIAACATSPRRTRDALAPSEPNGGTWIGVNDAGATLALINWYSVPARVAGQTVSRGEVVKLALPSDSSALVDAALAELPLARVNPFRLIGVFPDSQSRRRVALEPQADSNASTTAGKPTPGFPPASTNPARSKRAAKYLAKRCGKVPPEARTGFAASTARTAPSAAHTPPACTAKTRRR